MKNLISAFLLLCSIYTFANPIPKSPQEQCVDAHMRVWDFGRKRVIRKKNIWKKIETTKNINSFIRRNIMSSMTGNY